MYKVPSTDGPLSICTIWCTILVHFFYMFHYCTLFMLQLFSCCFMLFSLHDPLFCVALISCWTLSVLHFFILHSFQVSLFPCCTFFILHSFQVSLFLCCELFVLHFFHFTKFFSGTFFMLYSFLVALFPCCIFFMLHCFHVAPFFVLHCFYVVPFVHPFRVKLFSCCTLFVLHFFMLHFFHVEIFMLHYFRVVAFSCCTFLSVSLLWSCTFSHAASCCNLFMLHFLGI